MTRAEILWQSVKSYKIPGQSRKVNDLFCYPTSSPSVKKGWIPGIPNASSPPLPTHRKSMWKNGNKKPEDQKLFESFIIIFAFWEQRSITSDEVVRPPVCTLAFYAGHHAATARVCRNIAAANLGDVFKPERWLRSLNVGALRLRKRI